MKHSYGLRILCLLAGVALLTSCSTTHGLMQADAAEHARFNAYAGKPITEFRWITPGHRRAAIWTNQLIAWANINTVYLITVAPPCPDLLTAPTLGLSSIQGWVQARTSYVYAQGEPCRIATIQPVHYLRMLRAERKGGAMKAAAAP
jgi:hypothetical protein